MHLPVPSHILRLFKDAIPRLDAHKIVELGLREDMPKFLKYTILRFVTQKKVLRKLTHQKQAAISVTDGFDCLIFTV